MQTVDTQRWKAGTPARHLPCLRGALSQELGRPSQEGPVRPSRGRSESSSRRWRARLVTWMLGLPCVPRVYRDDG